jgi:hypothetical protein
MGKNPRMGRYKEKGGGSGCHEKMDDAFGELGFDN